MSKNAAIGAVIAYSIFVVLSMTRGVCDEYLQGSLLGVIAILVGIYLGDMIM